MGLAPSTFQVVEFKKPRILLRILCIIDSPFQKLDPRYSFSFASRHWFGFRSKTSIPIGFRCNQDRCTSNDVGHVRICLKHPETNSQWWFQECVCVCVCHTLFQRVSSSFQFDFQILDSFQDVTSSRGQQGVHSSAANEDSCECSVKQIETSICVPARFMK